MAESLPDGVVTDELIESYSRDGLVRIRGLFESWVERLDAGVRRNMAEPSDRGRIWADDGTGHVSTYDSQSWQQIPEYREFITDSCCAELAGRLLGGTRANFFFDAIFTRTAGTQFRTPFHQDEPYWSVEGFDTCSIWMPLVPVEQRSALEFVAGSHRWGEQYAQTNFGALTEDPRDQVNNDASTLAPFPDIEGERDRYDIRSWDMEPGDCVVFNARIIHGGSGNLAPDRALRVFNTQWLGDDVRVKFKPQGMDPDHRDVMTEIGLAPGDRVDSDLYPLLWTA